MTKQNIKVIKIPLATEEKLAQNRQQVFPRMPRLYLELLENKTKIKQDLVNKDYIPSSIININSKNETYSDYDKNARRDETSYDRYKEKDRDESYYDKHTEKDKEESSYDKYKYTEKEIDESSYDKYKEKDRDESSYDKYKEKDREESSYDKYKEKDRDESSYDKYNEKDRDESSYDKYNEKDRDESSYDKYKEKDRDESSYDKYKETNNSPDDKYKENEDENDDFQSKLDKFLSEDKEKEKEKERYDDDDAKSPSSDISDRLKELLNEKNDGKSNNRSDKYSRHRSLSNYKSVEHYRKTNEMEMPPTLAEIESRGGYIRKKELVDINQHNYNDQQEEDLKRELMFKIDLLKKSYPGSHIPEFSIHSDYQTMKKTYDSTVRRLSLDSSVDNYKSYLIGGFMVCEFLLGNYLGFDMQGFTQQQILSMNSYEKLLIELGEKSYMPQGSKWPVEVRLLFLIIMNAVIFIVSKMIMKKTGSNLLGMINGLNTNNQTSQSGNVQKKKMKPPSINLDEIPEASDL
jgi:hypothetical protein